LTDVVRAAEPDVVLHQLTDLTGQDRAANARVRTIGTRNLVDAARAAGTRRIVAQRIAFVYQDGPVPATEDVLLRAELAGVPDLDSAVAELPEWVVLRYGCAMGQAAGTSRTGRSPNVRARANWSPTRASRASSTSTTPRRRPSPRSTGRAGPLPPTAHWELKAGLRQHVEERPRAGDA
jgi:hypothetical protein